MLAAALIGEERSLMARTRSSFLASGVAYAAAVLLSLAGCEDSGKPLPSGDPGAPCVCAMGELGSDSACTAIYRNAQICPDQSPAQLCTRFINATTTYPVLVVNRGQSGLVISDVSLVGDDNCAFAPPQVSPPLGTIIPSGKNVFIQIAYRPTKAVSDFVELRIKSNAENFPSLVIPICGQGTPANMPPNQDGGTCLACMAARSQKAACGGAPDGGS